MNKITEIRIEEIFDEENDQHYYWIYYYKNEEIKIIKPTIDKLRKQQDTTSEIEDLEEDFDEDFEKTYKGEVSKILIFIS